MDVFSVVDFTLADFFLGNFFDFVFSSLILLWFFLSLIFRLRFKLWFFFHCVPKTMLFPNANNPKANKTESDWVCCFEIFDHLLHYFSSFKFQSNNGHCLDLKSTTILTSLHFSNSNNNNNSKVNRLKRSWHSLQYQDCKYSMTNSRFDKMQYAHFHSIVLMF